MAWEPISKPELLASITSAEEAIPSDLREFWQGIRIEPEKWSLEPWGDDGGGFWVVAIVGQKCIWYNDIEDGYNVSQFHAFGQINEYWCNKDELPIAVAVVKHEIEAGQRSARLGPPVPLAVHQHDMQRVEAAESSARTWLNGRPMPGLNALTYLTLVLVIETIYGLVGYLLYRGRAVSTSAFFDSDIVVFFAPMLTATGLVAILTVRQLPTWRRAAQLAVGATIGIIAASIAFSVYASIAFTRYGT